MESRQQEERHQAWQGSRPERGIQRRDRQRQTRGHFGSGGFKASRRRYHCKGKGEEGKEGSQKDQKACTGSQGSKATYWSKARGQRGFWKRL
jgi:hypothetical protein